MKLWILRPVRTLTRKFSGYYEETKPECLRGYDVYQGFVVRAEDEAQARSIAQKLHDGSREYEEGCSTDESSRVWRDHVMTTCTPVEVDGPAGLILADFHHG
jgi:hypothetical protein